jgi:phosphotransferase system enzyme I (PtsI)
MTNRVLRGVGVAPGIVVGAAHVIQWDFPEISRGQIERSEIAVELARLEEALDAVRRSFEDLRERTRQRAGEEDAKIFDAQIMMLLDPEFRTGVETLIRENQLSAERAFEFKTLEMRALWSQSTSYLLRQRVADLGGIQVRVLNHLLGRALATPIRAEGDNRPTIVFTRELTPGLTVQLERESVAALASVEGARTAHAAILARSLGIPCVMGVVGGLERIRDGMDVIVDGTHGLVILEPTAEEVEAAHAGERLRHELGTKLDEAAGQLAITTDGRTIELRGNVDLPEEIEPTVKHGAAGVGLLRTEFLVLGRTHLPSEDEQSDYFGGVARRFAGKPVLVRSYDLGGDKFPAAFQTGPEANPFLGWRAIRVCLDQPEIFRRQLRAILRARRHGDLRLMIPMVSFIEEIDCTRDLVAQCAAGLAEEGIDAASDIPLGVMVETPAAAILIDQIVARCDFVSVGTNDLTQYTLAIDRGNARLADRFSPHHPAVVQLLERVVDAAHRGGIEASVCGEMASDPLSAFMLIGLGYRILSVSPPSLSLIRWLIRQVDANGAVVAAEAALLASSMAEVEAILEQALAQYVDLQLLKGGRLPALVGTARFRGSSDRNP